MDSAQTPSIFEFFFPPEDVPTPVDQSVPAPTRPSEPAADVTTDLTVREAAKRLGITVFKAYNLVETGDLFVVRVGRELRVKPEEISRVLGKTDPASRRSQTSLTHRSES